jgi:hypothetical protein
MRQAYNILVGKAEEKRPFSRLTRRWKDNIKADFKEMVVSHLALEMERWWALQRNLRVL